VSGEHEAARLLPWYAAGTLEEEERARVRAHLESCPACAEALEGMRAFARALEGAAEEIREGHPEASLLLDLAEHPE
jgi:anti-sigma factor RsiW